jgi:ribosome maturation factor RimP
MLDERDPIESEYRLEVSSPGIDRPLTRAADWERWAGHLARVEMEEGFDSGRGTRKRFQGMVRGADGDTAVLDAEGLGEVRLPLSDVRAAKLVLTDALIAATVPLSAEGADEIEDENVEGDGGQGPANDNTTDQRG